VSPDKKAAATGILVIGMHRSGTSATAGALALLGVQLGERLIAGAPDNPKGYWEHAGAVTVDEELLTALSRGWDDVRALPDGWTTSAAAVAARAGIAGIVSSLGSSPLWAIKDPRLSRLLPLWLSEITKTRQQVVCLFVVRHPGEVASSLAMRNGLPLVAGHLLWARHVLEAIEHSEGCVRHMISYEELLGAPEKCLRRAAEKLQVKWPRPIARSKAELASFLERAEPDRTGRSHQETDAAKASPIASLVERLYARCLEIGKGEADWNSVQEFVAEFETFERAHTGWIAALGQSQRAAAQSRAQLLRLDADASRQLVAQIAELESAKAAAEHWAVSRLELLSDSDHRLSQIEQMALDRLVELEKSTAANARASKEYGNQASELHERVADLESAKAAAEQLALSRLQELSEGAQRIGELEQLAVARLDELERATQAHALALAAGHAQANALRERIIELEAAKAEIEELAISRLQAIADEQAHSAELDAA
jgi:hypothetical protein